MSNKIKCKNMSDRQTNNMSDCIYYMNIKYKWQIDARICEICEIECEINCQMTCHLVDLLKNKGWWSNEFKC
jgi:hypothetical protein